MLAGTQARKTAVLVSIRILGIPKKQNKKTPKNWHLGEKTEQSSVAQQSLTCGIY